jgi:predicted nucleic acid-binding protein
MVYADAKLETLALEILRQYDDQDFSYADAVSFAVMRQRGVSEAFTFDHHFSILGFLTLPEIKVTTQARP